MLMVRDGGKLGPASIGSALCNCKGEVLLMFSEHVGVYKSNEV